MNTRAYNRTSAIIYAKKWSLSRNPRYYNFDDIGGDCTNFISQCLFAGSNKMNNNYEHGGEGIAVRNPVYLEDGTGQEYFWGFTIVILRVPENRKLYWISSRVRIH